MNVIFFNIVEHKHKQYMIKGISIVKINVINCVRV